MTRRAARCHSPGENSGLGGLIARGRHACNRKVPNTSKRTSPPPAAAADRPTPDGNRLRPGPASLMTIPGRPPGAGPDDRHGGPAPRTLTRRDTVDARGLEEPAAEGR